MTSPTATVDRQSARSGYAMVAIAASLWGTWSLFLRPAERISHLDPAFETFLMFATMAVTVTPFALRDRPATRRSRPSWVLMIALGATDAANVGCFFWAMQKGSLAVAVLFHYLAPLFIALTAPLVLGERVRFPVVALASALTGLALLVAPGAQATGEVTASAVLGSASAVFYAMTTLLNKRLERDFSVRELLGYHSVASALLMAPFLFAGRGGTLLAVGYIVAGAVVLSSGGTLVYLSGLRRVPASRAAVLTLLEPAVALFVGAVVWNEPVTPRGAFGALLVLVGAYLVLAGGGATATARKVLQG